jgi:UDP-N-acetylglucosamine/UDP-N-acetylgalactosamine diphosphorylase
MDQVDDETAARIDAVGYDAIRNGKVAAVILSGGQGTRLGYSGPKGMYSIGLLSGKSIFQLHIERLQKIRLLSATHSSSESLSGEVSLPVFIMTSDVNDELIKRYFKENNYFGYPANQIFFFEQGLEPCFSFDGKIMLESADQLSLAPDGNGGIYQAMRKSGLSHTHTHTHTHTHSDSFPSLRFDRPHGLSRCRASPCLWH